MASTTSETDEPRPTAYDSAEDEAGPSAVARAVAGANVLASQQLHRARDRVNEELSSQRDRVTGRVRTLSRALRGASQTLEEDDVVAQCLHLASDKIEDVAGYVSQASPARVADDLREIARERPAWFFGGVFVLGLALGRFARSTAAGLAESETARDPRKRSAAGNRRARQAGSAPEGVQARTRAQK